MEKKLDVHVLPCLIKEPGEAAVKLEFSDRTFHSGSTEPHRDAPLGDFTLRDICGTIAEDVDFQVDMLEHFEQDVYSSKEGTDRLLGRERLCNFLRGRCLRGCRMDLDALGCRLSVVEVSKSQSRDNKIVRHASIPCQLLTEKEGVASMTLWEQDKDISPLSANVAGYKHLLMASPLSDHTGEMEFVMGLD